MRHTTDALLVSLVFLLRVERGISQQVCNYNQCFVVIQGQYDFEGSQTRCLERGGHLMTVQSLDKHKELVRLLRDYTGNYWIGLLLPGDKCPDSASQLRGYRWIVGDKATDFHNWGGFDASCSSKCVSVSPENNSTWWQESCKNNGLKGFICEYPLVEPCNPLVLKSGEFAEYTTDLKFEGSLAYPPGTTAIKKPSEFKYICFSERWLQAPWSCEVMNGGCEQVCNSYNQQYSCACASGGTLHANKVSCAKEDPCSGCAHHCPKEGDSYVCRCHKGYALAEDRKGCVDINECLDRDRCTGESTECVNTEGGFECICREGFVFEDDKCISVEICDKCEHLKCEKTEGVYKCFCRSGFVVSDKDPTKCEIHCTQQDCSPKCIPDPDPAKQELQCDCPDGYIQDIRNGTSICTDIDECDDPRLCDHACRNTYGGYTCSCDEGFDLYDGHECIASDDGSGSTTPDHVSTPNVIYPTAIPPYVKTGSVLGIVVFVALFMSLLYFVVRRALKRCRKFEIPSLRGADVDLFHLQQVTTEKYKRFSFDKQWRNDPQRQ